MSRTRTRSLAAVGFLVATGLFLTACGPEKAAAGSGAVSVSDTETRTESGTESGATDGAQSSAGNGAGSSADGTFTGKLTYRAPGKLLVGDRAFFVAEDTDIQGGDICGDPENSTAEKCTADEADAAAKDGNLTVEVTIKSGIAEKVTQV